MGKEKKKGERIRKQGCSFLLHIISVFPFLFNLVLLDHVFFRAVTFYSAFSESWQQWCIFLVVP